MAKPTGSEVIIDLPNNFLAARLRESKKLRFGEKGMCSWRSLQAQR